MQAIRILVPILLVVLGFLFYQQRMLQHEVGIMRMAVSAILPPGPSPPLQPRVANVRELPARVECARQECVATVPATGFIDSDNPDDLFATCDIDRSNK